MEILATLTVGLILGAVCGALTSRPSAMAAFKRDLTQVWAWLFAPIEIAQPPVEYVGRHRIESDLDALKEVIDDALEPAAV